MITIFPAIVSSSLPAFDGTQGDGVRFYFNLSILNTRDEIKSCYIRIRSLENNRNPLSIVKFPRGVQFFENSRIHFDGFRGLHYIVIPNSSFSTDESGDYAGLNQFYKIQIVLSPYDIRPAGHEYEFYDTTVGSWRILSREEMEIGEDRIFSEYSAPTILKPIVPPNVTITFDSILSPIFNFVGSYRNAKDPSERLVAYHFEIYEGTKFIERGDSKKIGLYEADNISWQNKVQLDENKTYKVQLHFETKNGYIGFVEKSTPTKFTATKLKALISPNVKEDIGAIDLSIVFETKLYTTDNLIIHRASLSESGGLDFRRMAKIKGPISRIIKYRDYTVEDGVAYIYTIQAENVLGQLGNLTPPVKTIPRFDNYFILGEGDKQFSVLYDGRISNVTHKSADAVIETLGSKYPYVVKNAIVNYKTFSFSAKITYHQDVQKEFAKDTYTETISNDGKFNEDIEQLYISMLRDEVVDTKKRQDSMIYQRTFRTKFLEWVKDGKPKMLKTPFGGSTLVRITNVTETPIPSIGNLISDFNCTMTEIGAADLDTLWDFGLIRQDFTNEELIQKPLNTIGFDGHTLTIDEEGDMVVTKGGPTPKLILRAADGSRHSFGVTNGRIYSEESVQNPLPNPTEQIFDGGALVTFGVTEYGEIVLNFYAGR